MTAFPCVSTSVPWSYGWAFGFVVCILFIFRNKVRKSSVDVTSDKLVETQKWSPKSYQKRTMCYQGYPVGVSCFVFNMGFTTVEACWAFRVNYMQPQGIESGLNQDWITWETSKYVGSHTVFQHISTRLYGWLVPAFFVATLQQIVGPKSCWSCDGNPTWLENPQDQLSHGLFPHCIDAYHMAEVISQLVGGLEHVFPYIGNYHPNRRNLIGCYGIFHRIATIHDTLQCQTWLGNPATQWQNEEIIELGNVPTSHVWLADGYTLLKSSLMGCGVLP